MVAGVFEPAAFSALSFASSSACFANCSLRAFPCASSFACNSAFSFLIISYFLQALRVELLLVLTQM
ncbi:hypothetical protein HMPREF1232_0109 [Streptococcus pyogenes GA40468]|nr:hypothetical protein HMPREF1232_0109 [Streptococcus pyogenes GA40468]